MLTRRQFLTRILPATGLFGLSVSGISYGCFFEPRRLELSETEVSLPGMRDEIKILHLSDFHHSSVVSLDFIKEAIVLGLSAKPDLVCITGDFVTGKKLAKGQYEKVLKLLPERAPTFACLGNHDGGRWAHGHRGFADTTAIANLLRDSGIVLLHNKVYEAKIRDQDVVLIGVGDLWAGETDPDKAFKEFDKTHTAPRIVLSHNPDSKDFLGSHDWDLMLCGHTHGGQLIIPFIGAPFAPIRDHRFSRGLNIWNDRPIHTTRGVGNLYGVRINCRPEVSVLKIGTLS